MTSPIASENQIDRNWIEASALDIDDILKLLPHRYPFLLVDRVLEIKPSQPLSHKMSAKELMQLRVGSYARVIKNVTYNEFHFQGHFPGNPIFPGVLTLEAMAQAAVFVAVPFVAAAAPGKFPVLNTTLAGFNKVRFRKMIRPGDQLEIRVETTQSRGQIWEFSGVVTVDGVTAAEGSFLAQLAIGGLR